MKNALTTFVLLIAFLGLAQDKATLKEYALRDAQKACEATLKEDFKSLLVYTHPNILNAGGGAEVMEEFLISTFNQMKASGFKYLVAETKSVSDIVEEQGEYRCFVENYNEMIMNNQKITSTSYLVGVFDDTKEHWYFVEAKELLKGGTVSAYFPDFATSMNIPENKMEIVEIQD